MTIWIPRPDRLVVRIESRTAIIYQWGNASPVQAIPRKRSPRKTVADIATLKHKSVKSKPPPFLPRSPPPARDLFAILRSMVTVRDSQRSQSLLTGYTVPYLVRGDAKLQTETHQGVTPACD